MSAGKIFRVLFVLSVVVLIADGQQSRKRNRNPYSRRCTLSKAEALKCARAALIFGDREQFVPTTYEETGPLCDRMYDSIDCLQKYGFCLDRFRHSMLKVFLRHMKEELPTFYCSDSGRQFMLENIRCIDKSQIRSEATHRCMDKYTYIAEMIRGMSEDDQVIAGCCAFQFMRRCIKEFADEVCIDITGPETAKYWDNGLVRAYNAMQGFVCNNRWDTIPRCMRASPNITQSFEDVFRGPDVPILDDSPLFIFLDIMGQRNSAGVQ